MQIDGSIREIRGIGPKKAELLSGLGIRTIRDALYHFPRSYVDRSVVSMLGSVENLQRVTVKVRVESIRSAPTHKGFQKSPLRLLVSDGTGKAEILFFNGKFLNGKFRLGETYFFHGVIKKERAVCVMQHPEFCAEQDWFRFSVYTPLYPLTAGLTQTDLRNLLQNIIGKGVFMQETLPDRVVSAAQLMPITQAVRGIHCPMGPEEAEAARRRFAFEELYLLQLALLTIKKSSMSMAKKHIYLSSSALEPLFAALPFKLTQGQKQVLSEILEDMDSTKLMNRLIQGDVGSGKTVLALAAVAYAALSGHQASIMAPTEILAKQHFDFFSKYLSLLGVSTVLLTGGVKSRSQALSQIANGNVQVVIGTHALIQDGVSFNNLGLVITDEQHRFGVRQRNTLARKSQDHPDMLFMSATPIPRTLSLILYGDVDVSYLKEMPSGRIPIKTRYVKEGKRKEMYGFVNGELESGSQVYVVCPLVADSEEVDGAAAESHFETLRAGPFMNRRVGLVHGKMKAADKERVMRQFVSGEIQVLVSTTVIEVGVDVPNASVMIIEDSNRFGLAQLHQLRGRVGRGHKQSWCFLMASNPGKVAIERIKTLVQSSDGFEIAQKDLTLRGPGEVLGVRQHGLPELKAADILKDWQLMEKAQALAVETSRNQVSSESEKLFLDRFIGELSI